MKNILCPVCKAPLNFFNEGKALKCNAGHSFDLARQGFANLLLSNQKKSKQPGDSPEMVVARTRFLDKGFYSGLSKFLVQKLNELYEESENAPSTLLDIGCGEGYYTTQIADKLLSQNSQYPKTVCTGVDISAPAIKAACRRSKLSQGSAQSNLVYQWLIASAYDLPVADASQDLILYMFCRVALEEAIDKLRPNGRMVVVSTGMNHLIEMRHILYSDVRESRPFEVPSESSAKISENWQFRDKITIEDSEDMKALLMMTPHAWRSSPDNQARLCEALPLDLTIDIDIKILQA